MRNLIVGHCIFLLTLLSVAVTAQQLPDERLETRLATLKQDSIRWQVFDSLHRHALTLPYEQAVDYAERVVELAHQSGHIAAEVDAYRNVGQLHFEHNRLSPALDNFRRAYDLADEVGGTQKVAATLHFAGFFNSAELWTESKEKAQEAIIRSGALRNFQLMFKSRYLMMLLEYNLKNYEACILEAEEAITIFNKHNRPDWRTLYEGISAYNTIGLCYSMLNDLPKSLEAFDKAEALAQKNNVEVWVAIVHGNRSKVFAKQNRLPEALQQALYEFRVTKKLHEWNDAGNSVLAVAGLYTRMKNFSMASRYLDSARLILPNTRDYRIVTSFWQNRYELFESQGKFREAHNALKRLNEVRDSANVETEKGNLKRTVVRYELQHRDSEIQLLEAQNALSESEIAQQNFQRKALIGALVMFAVIIVMVYIAFHNKRKSNKLLTSRNDTIEQQREELTQSIENLKIVQDQLLQAEKMASLGQLTAGIAHEINNPLNFVSGGVDALQHQLDDFRKIAENQSPEIRDALKESEGDFTSLLQVISSGVQRMNKIIMSLRTFSGPQQYELSAITVEEPIEVALTILSSKIKDAQIEVTKNYSELAPISANDTQLSQVFLNIIDNAIFALATKEQPRTINIKTEMQGSQVLITVADNGPGIPASIQNKIMDPFFTTKEVGKGTGLGLAISLGIISNHGGTIRVSSKEGQGATFSVLLPVNQ